MRAILKTANRFDSIWTTALMMPALIMMMNAGIALHNGTGSTAQFTESAKAVAGTVTDQYLPYIQATSNGILAGTKKLSKVASHCLSGSSGPVYLTPGMAHRTGCSLGNGFSSHQPIRPYTHY